MSCGVVTEALALCKYHPIIWLKISICKNHITRMFQAYPMHLNTVDRIELLLFNWPTSFDFVHDLESRDTVEVFCLDSKQILGAYRN